MIYRAVTPADWPGIADCTTEAEYFDPVDASTLDGVQLVAVDDDGKVHGFVWAMVCGRHAYVDYLCVRRGTYGKVALQLVAILQAALEAMGVRWVRGVVYENNGPAVRLFEAAGMDTRHCYTVVTKELSNGHHEK